jgi:secretion/DNA translocation related TadE-like protein
VTGTGRPTPTPGAVTGGGPSTPPRPNHPRADRGSATVWTVCAVAVLCVVFGVVLALGQAVVARHRAAGGADLAALAAADHWTQGATAACARAEEAARAQGTRLVRCALVGDVSDVTAAAGRGPFAAEVRARAGPPDGLSAAQEYPKAAPASRPDPKAAPASRPDAMGAAASRSDPMGGLASRSDPMGGLASRQDPTGGLAAPLRSLTASPSPRHDPLAGPVARQGRAGALTPPENRRVPLTSLEDPPAAPAPPEDPTAPPAAAP